jgi:cystathionine beta-lyase/cystathionine gamma-synthase
MEEHNRSAQSIAEWLEKHPAVNKVYYPGLKSSHYHELATGLMGGFGGVVSFEVGSGEKAMKLLKALAFIKTAPSLGGAETLITHPATSSHKSISVDERRELGISEGLLRLSVGLEGSKEIIADLEIALSKM